MLPFLKNKEEGAASSEIETSKRKPDDDHEYEMLDAIVEDMLEAISKTDRPLLKESLKALCEYIKDEDKEQDEELTE